MGCKASLKSTCCNKHCSGVPGNVADSLGGDWIYADKNEQKTHGSFFFFFFIFFGGGGWRHCIAYKRKVPRFKGSLSDLGKLFFMCWTMMGDWWPTLRVFIKLVRSTGRHGESSWDIWCRIGQRGAKNCRQCTLCSRPNQMLLSDLCSSPSVLIINISIKIVGQCTTVYSISWSRWYRSCCHQSQFWIHYYYPFINPRAFCLLQCTQLYFYQICILCSFGLSCPLSSSTCTLKFYNQRLPCSLFSTRWRR